MILYFFFLVSKAHAGVWLSLNSLLARLFPLPKLYHKLVMSLYPSVSLTTSYTKDEPKDKRKNISRCFRSERPCSSTHFI